MLIQVSVGVFFIHYHFTGGPKKCAQVLLTNFLSSVTQTDDPFISIQKWIKGGWPYGYIWWMFGLLGHFKGKSTNFRSFIKKKALNDNYNTTPNRVLPTCELSSKVIRLEVLFYSSLNLQDLVPCTKEFNSIFNQGD